MTPDHLASPRASSTPGLPPGLSLLTTACSSSEWALLYDHDVLVAPGDFADVLNRLESAGASLLDDDWCRTRRLKLASLRYRLPGGRVVRVRWSLFDDPELRAIYPAFQALDRRRPAGQAFVLDAVDDVLRRCLDPEHDELDLTEAMRFVSVAAVLSRANACGVYLPTVAAMRHRATGVPRVRVPGPWGLVLTLARGHGRLLRVTRPTFRTSVRAALSRPKRQDPAPRHEGDTDRGLYLDDLFYGRL